MLSNSSMGDYTHDVFPARAGMNRAIHCAGPVNGGPQTILAGGPSFAQASHSSGFDRRRRSEALCTAMATAFF